MSAVPSVKARRSATFSASSATVSATMSAAPASAFSGVSNPASAASGVTKGAAASSEPPFLGVTCMMIMLASGSSPASRAFWARVMRFLR